MSQAELKRQRDAILVIARKYGASRLRVFGSMARGDESPGSDIDLLVELQPGRTLFDLGGLGAELENLLGARVDVVTESGLEPEVRRRVIAEAIAL